MEQIKFKPGQCMYSFRRSCSAGRLEDSGRGEDLFEIRVGGSPVENIQLGKDKLLTLPSLNSWGGTQSRDVSGF